MSRLIVAFDEPEHGWLGLVLESGALAYSDTFSHIYSSLPNLCEALCDVARGRSSRAVTFLLEPHELELTIALDQGNRCKVTMERYKDHRREDGMGEVVFRHEGSRESVVLTFWRALRRLQTCLPEADFATHWRAPFPAAEMSLLTSAVTELKATAGAGATNQRAG